MNLKEKLVQWGMSSLKIKLRYLEAEWLLDDEDKNAAWELYIELLTKITTQALPREQGDEQTALNSIYSLFSITREIIRRRGRKCLEFTKISIVILNQVVRPFTAKWHKLSLHSAFEDDELCDDFREELELLQEMLVKYSKMLADMAGVEDLTDLEDV